MPRPRFLRGWRAAGQTAAASGLPRCQLGRAVAVDPGQPRTEQALPAQRGATGAEGHYRPQRSVSAGGGDKLGLLWAAFDVDEVVGGADLAEHLEARAELVGPYVRQRVERRRGTGERSRDGQGGIARVGPVLQAQRPETGGRPAGDVTDGIYRIAAAHPQRGVTAHAAIH